MCGSTIRNKRLSLNSFQSVGRRGLVVVMKHHICFQFSDERQPKCHFQIQCQYGGQLKKSKPKLLSVLVPMRRESQCQPKAMSIQECSHCHILEYRYIVTKQGILRIPASPRPTLLKSYPKSYPNKVSTTLQFWLLLSLKYLLFYRYTYSKYRCRGRSIL